MRVNRGVALVVLAATVLVLLACGDDVESICLEGDTTFVGGYTIEEESDIAPLESYTCISGDLRVSAAELTGLELPNLERIGGDLVLAPSVNYQDLPSLNLISLVSVGGNLHIIEEKTLENLSGLSSLSSIGGELEIGGNEALTSLAGLSHLVSVGENLAINLNPSLTSLGMNALTEVGGGMSITQNSSLPQCEACELVEQVGGDPQGVNANLHDSCANYICY